MLSERKRTGTSGRKKGGLPGINLGRESSLSGHAKGEDHVRSKSRTGGELHETRVLCGQGKEIAVTRGVLNLIRRNVTTCTDE